METSYLKTLELDKIIARAAEGCVCKEARAMLLAIEPQCDPDEVRYALEQTDAINTLLIKNGSPRFGGVEGVSQLAARAVKGGVLSMGELLMVAGALRNFQHLTSWYGSSEHDALPTDDLFYALAPEPGLEQQISSAILAPDAMADTASRTLAELRKKIRATENSIRDRLESMVRNMDTSKYLQESVVSGQERVPRRGERYHSRCILYGCYGVRGTAGCGGGKRPHSAVPRTGGTGDRAHSGGLYRTGGRH